MKNVILTLIIGFSTLSLKANHFSNLNINIADRANYEVIFNNQFLGNNGNSFTLNQVAPGRYPLLVTKIIPTHWGFQKKIIYNGGIEIPAGAEVSALIDRFNRLQISWRPFAPVNTYTPDHCGTPPAGYYEPMPIGMHPNAFGQLKSTINNQWFDSGKLQVARQAISMNSLTAAQVAELMQLFSFESSKLELAKMAFANTVDKQNYYIVNNAFWFSSSVAELDQYISHM